MIMTKSKIKSTSRKIPTRSSKRIKECLNRDSDKHSNSGNLDTSSNTVINSNTNTSTNNPWYNHYTKNDIMYNNYMENEWSYEICNDDNALFEKLCLEGAQSGLSWRTILNKRQAYRDAFHGFDILKVSQMTSSDIDHIMSSDSSNSNSNSNSVKKSKNDIVVRHRGKLESVIHNAKQILIMLEQKSNDNDDDDDNNNRQSQSQEAYKYTSFSNYLWSFVNYKPILNKWSNFDEIPSSSNESETMSRGLKSRGFKFVGPTTCYSLMQSCGFVIDHPVDTPQWSDALKRLQERKGGYQSVQKGE